MENVRSRRAILHQCDEAIERRQTMLDGPPIVACT